ncbi:MAG: hypothetical protein MZU91_03130 [Desulfosudis oleivorans]|nr:hypothetical protein [Desulfosudis oleivorans]
MNNPKTPLSIAMAQVSYLNQRDLGLLAKSKGVARSIVIAARGQAQGGKTVKKAGVLTLSDKGSAGLRQDLSGPIIQEILTGLGISVEITEIIPDDQRPHQGSSHCLVR